MKTVTDLAMELGIEKAAWAVGAIEEIKRLLKIEQAARDLFEYERNGGPDWLDWDEKYQALWTALEQ
jgi:hypothetical protein